MSEDIGNVERIVPSYVLVEAVTVAILGKDRTSLYCRRTISRSDRK
jgi:hypothetical protein